MVMLMLEKEEAVGKAFNCGTGKPTKIDHLAQTIIDLYGKGLKPEFQPDRSAGIKYSVADNPFVGSSLGCTTSLSIISQLSFE